MPDEHSDTMLHTDAIRAELARKVAELEKRNLELRIALRFYAVRDHMTITPNRSKGTLWLTAGMHGQPIYVESGTIAVAALEGRPIDWYDDAPDPIPNER